jgi:nucleoside-diphosphate-sugar epimerase
MQQAHVLVTGGNGYIGNALVETLLSRGHRVTVVDWMVYGPGPLAPFMNDPRFRLLAADVRHLDPEVLGGVDVICDLAALSNDPSGDLDVEITRSINFRARRRLGLLAKAYGVKRYLLASSCSVYGAGHETDCTEESKVNPLTEYALCNRLSEEALFKLNDADFAVTAFRNATVFGLSRRMRFDLAVNIMTYHATTKGKLVVNGDGSQNRPFIHLRDVARAMAMAIEAPVEKVAGEIFNLCHGNVTIKELADDIVRTLPEPVEVTYSPADMDNRDYRVNADKVKEVLGFVPEISVADGILEVFNAVRSGGTELSFETRTLDVYKRLVDAGTLTAEKFTDLPKLRRRAS